MGLRIRRFHHSKGAEDKPMQTATSKADSGSLGPDRVQLQVPSSVLARVGHVSSLAEVKEGLLEEEVHVQMRC